MSIFQWLYSNLSLVLPSKLRYRLNICMVLVVICVIINFWLTVYCRLIDVLDFCSLILLSFIVLVVTSQSLLFCNYTMSWSCTTTVDSLAYFLFFISNSCYWFLILLNDLYFLFLISCINIFRHKQIKIVAKAN